MFKVAVLDDYQNVFSQIINLEKYKTKYEFKIFNEPFQSELVAIEDLKMFEALFIMRERTKLTRSLISNLPNSSLRFFQSRIFRHENVFCGNVYSLLQGCMYIVYLIKK